MKFILPAALAASILLPGLTHAQTIDSGVGSALGELSRTMTGGAAESGPLSGRIIQMIGLMTLLSLAPGLLIVMTSFTRFVIVLSMLRTAIGLNQSPPNMVITSLALFLTLFVMQPVFQQSWEKGVAPLINGHITEEVAIQEISAPFHAFMAANTRDEDISLFLQMKSDNEGEAIVIEDRTQIPWTVLVPAFMISELKKAFTIGFLIFLPFIAIDLIVASILMGAGMMMLSPVMISLPFKIIFFVLVDGWYMLAGSLMKSYIGI